MRDRFETEGHLEEQKREAALPPKNGMTSLKKKIPSGPSILAFLKNTLLPTNLIYPAFLDAYE